MACSSDGDDGGAEKASINVEQAAPSGVGAGASHSGADAAPSSGDDGGVGADGTLDAEGDNNVDYEGDGVRGGDADPDAKVSGCASVPAGSTGLGLLALVGLIGIRRRQD